MNRMYSIQEIELKLQRKSWWAMVFILPVARRLSLFLINQTNISPNAITIGSFLFIFGAACAFAYGSYNGLIIAAFLFEINYLLDCVDGTVARVKGMHTPMGAFLDPALDRLRIFLLTAALAYGQFSASRSIEIVFLLFLYLGLNNLLLFTRQAQERAIMQIGIKGKTSGVDLALGGTRSGLLARWLNFTSSRNTMPYYHDVELDALVFVIGPIVNKMVFCLIAANVLALVLILLLNILFLLSLRRSQGVK